ncbi:hypothetical protein [Muribaculum intestinale]|uniref:hypothetical protein n=1 Tax=Muribaculum intestinale TaxID=1796646 RepID=UPI0025B6548F|nr:hypothetical protein [Muribaculum intestinale]
MEIKVGDKVRVSKDAPEMYFFGCNYDNSVCKVILVDRDNAVITQVKNGSFAIPTKYLTKVEDEAKAKYKVGDKVRVLGHALLEGGVFTITFVEHREKRGWMYRINTHTWFPESDLAPYTEPTEENKPMDLTKEVANNLSNALEGCCNAINNIANNFDWDTYTADLAHDIAVKIVNKNMSSNPDEVGEYSVKVAKSVVEGLKRK